MSKANVTRVLIGMPAPGTRGGPGACEPPFVAALRERGVEATEVAFVYGDNLGRTGLVRRVRRVVMSALALRRAVRENKFDLVHLNTSFDAKSVLRDAFTLAVLGRSAPPVFLKLHGSDPTLASSGPRLLRGVARRLLMGVAGIGVLSGEELDAFARAGISRDRLHLVRNALPDSPPAGSRDEFRSTYGLPRDTALILFISRIIGTKGLIDTVHAMAPLRANGRRVLLVCVGDGPARASAEAESRHLGLDDSVRFLGYLPEAEASRFYHHCDVLAFPTFHDEGLPVVLLHALAAGLPIVTTRTRAAADYLDEPATCLWVEPHRPDQLAARLEAVLDDPALRAAMSANARRRALLFTPADVSLSYLDLYRRITAAAAPVRPQHRFTLGHNRADH